MEPATTVFNQFTYVMLIVSASGLLVYGYARSVAYVSEDKSFIWSAIAEILTVIPGCAAIYQITANFELAALMVVFFAVGSVPALLPRFWRYRHQMAEAWAERKQTEGVFNGLDEAEQ